jgi:hypothetical protein
MSDWYVIVDDKPIRVYGPFDRDRAESIAELATGVFIAAGNREDAIWQAGYIAGLITGAGYDC